MSKKKAELTLEELQARKSKRQRGWVRVCAIILAIVLTGGVYGLAAKGGPRKQKYAPSVVQVNGGTVVQKEESKAPAEEAPAPAPAPSTSEEEGGGILDTIMGLISGFDFGSLIEKLNPGQLGITVADKIDVFKDNLIDKINEIQGSINKKPVITHEATEEAFPADADLGSLEDRQNLVDLYNNLMKAVVAEKRPYQITRNTSFLDDGHVNVGSKTDTVNQILNKASKGQFTLDSIANVFTGGGAQMVYVEPGMTVQDAINAMSSEDEKKTNQAAILAEIKPTDLRADDIRIDADNTFPDNGQYTFCLKNVYNPNREKNSGFTRLTDDYVVQGEVAKKIQDSVSKGTGLSVVKLTDLNTAYTDITITVQVDTLSENVTSVNINYNRSGKFVARTNTVQITGKAASNTNVYYEFFYGLN